MTCLAGPPPAFAELLERVRGALELVPRLRQRAVGAPGPLGALAPPRWIGDPAFSLQYHVRRTALPAAGDRERLRRLSARLFSQALDPTKPLWELWVVEGVDGDGWALIEKTHLALGDGVALLTALFDGVERPGAAAAWTPRPVPSAAQRQAGAVDDLVGIGLRGGAVRATARAVRGAARGRRTGSGRSPLRTPVGPHRRVASLDVPLADVKGVKDALGATVNDVVLAALAGGLRSWLHARGQRAQGVDVRACLPVATAAGTLRPVEVTLPTTRADARERLEVVRSALADVKATVGAVGADALTLPGAPDAPTLLARASRLAQLLRTPDLVLVNVPGPAAPRTVLGRPVTSLIPLGVLGPERALAIACTSHDGRVHFGFLADYDAVPDLPELADGVARALAELVAVAQDPVQARRKTRPTA